MTCFSNVSVSDIKDVLSVRLGACIHTRSIPRIAVGIAATPAGPIAETASGTASSLGCANRCSTRQEERRCPPPPQRITYTGPARAAS